MAREATFWPREEIQKAEDLHSEITMKEPEEVGETTMAEESDECKIHRLQRSQDMINVINLILHYKNYVPEEEKLRQIRVVVE